MNSDHFVKNVLEPKILLRMRPLSEFDAGITEGLRMAGKLIRREEARESIKKSANNIRDFKEIKSFEDESFRGRFVSGMPC